MITTNKGNNAPINAPRPLDMNRMLQVLRLFANISRNTATNNSDLNCLRLGQGSPLSLKKTINITPAINWRMAEICNPGTFSTAILLATQVLPHIKLVAKRAR
jgi:hypothetical protein